MDGIIFNIKRYAIHDGPGIRVSFFLKGCPMACWWCHNPEGISPDTEFVERIDRIGEKEFRVEEELGIKYSVDDLEKVAEKERVFIEESGGGITFSGGEPLMQSKFLMLALKRFKKIGFHTCIDTSGQADSKIVESLLPLTDLFLFDIKHLNNEMHKKYTGISNTLLLSNYKRIMDSGKDVIVRIPLIPGFNDDVDHLEQLRHFLSSFNASNLKRVDLLPYHKIGSSKYKRFGIKYRMEGVEQPSQLRMNELKEYFSLPGLRVKIGG